MWGWTGTGWYPPPSPSEEVGVPVDRAGGTLSFRDRFLPGDTWEAGVAVLMPILPSTARGTRSASAGRQHTLTNWSSRPHQAHVT